MRRGKFQRGLFRLVFDSSSLINIKNKHQMKIMRSRISDVIIPDKVAEELTCPEASRSDPLYRFVINNPNVIAQLQDNEEIEYLRIRSQAGIHDGEAAAITIAIVRNFPLVVDDRRARNKARNHGVNILDSNDFINP